MTYHVDLSGPRDVRHNDFESRDRLAAALEAARVCQRNWPRSQQTLRWVGQMLHEYEDMVHNQINTRDLLGGARKYIHFAMHNPPEYATVWLQAIVALIGEQLKLHDCGGRDAAGNFVPLDYETIR